MRDIKFRAWDKVNNLMSKVTMINYNDLSSQLNILNSKGHFSCLFCDVELMQYTGLKDKNGVEIYEGDICRCLGGSEFNGHYEYNRIYEVKWQGSGLEMMIDDCGYGWNYSSGFEYIEVIGNIYENQELLNK